MEWNEVTSLYLFRRPQGQEDGFRFVTCQRHGETTTTNPTHACHVIFTFRVTQSLGSRVSDRVVIGLSGGALMEDQA